MSTKGQSSMFRICKAQELDIQTLKGFKDIPTATRDNTPRKNFDGVVIRKPWGFEYLACESELVALWALKLQFNQQTSMHCHPEKLTVMLALSDGIVLTTLTGAFKLNTGDVVYLEPGVFHRSSSTNLDGDWLLEFETPVDKFDLVRLDDAYGRSVSAYEGSEHHTSPEDIELIQWLSRYNYVTPKESTEIGKAEISFYRFLPDSEKLIEPLSAWASKMNLVVLVSEISETSFDGKALPPLEFISPHDTSRKVGLNTTNYEFALGIRW